MVSFELEEFDEYVTVYNLEIDDFHTYFVGDAYDDADASVLVYNTYKKPKAGSGKDRASDIPSWGKGERPYVGESGNNFADRILTDKYGEGNFPKGPGTEHNKFKKYGDRGFEK